MVRRLVGRLLAPILAALVGAVLAGVAANAGAVSATPAAQAVPGTTVLEQVACPTASTCIAVGQGLVPSAMFGQIEAGVVVPLSVSSLGVVTAGPAVVVLSPASFSADLSEIACWSAGSCTAYGEGYRGYYEVPITIGSSGGLSIGAVSGPDSFEVTANACSSGTCVTGGLYTMADVGEVFGSTGAVTFLPPASYFHPQYLACASASVCIATDSDSRQIVPLVISPSGMSAGSPVTLARVGPVACPSPTYCIMTTSGPSGVVQPLGVSSSGTITVGSAQPPPGPPGASPGAAAAGGTFACPTAEICELSVGGDISQASVATSGTTAFGASQAVPGLDVDALACPTATTCVAVGSNSTGSGVVASLPVPLLSVAPTSGPTYGSTWTDVTGTNLSPGGAYCVWYDFSACGSVTVYFGAEQAFIAYDSPTQIVVLTPAEPPGIVDVTVKAASGTSITVGTYTYT
jgi:IPT/TIG domain